MVDGVEEHTVDKIIAHRKIGRGHYRTIPRTGTRTYERWIAGRELEDNEALDLYWKSIL